jgi:hypothetical protein
MAWCYGEKNPRNTGVFHVIAFKKSKNQALVEKLLAHCPAAGL